MLNHEGEYILLNKGDKTIRLRKSLFWDIPGSELNSKKNMRLILERVFSRGNLEEFSQVNKIYTEKEIRQTIVKIRTFDKKTLHFLSGIYHLKPSDFHVAQRSSL